MSAAGIEPPRDMPQFWSFFQQRHMSLDVIGPAQSWAAPVARVLAPDGFAEDVWLDAIPDHVIAVHLSGARVSKVRGIGAGKGSLRGGSFALQPRGTDNHYIASGPCSFAQILINDTLLDRASNLVGQPGLSGRLRPDLIFDRSLRLNGLAETYVQRALTTRLPPTTLEMEARALLLLDEIFALHGEARPNKALRGGLPPRQLQRVTDFMREHAAQDLLLDDLAALVGLSPTHFARAFRQSTGVPPHRWLTNLRIERARELLEAGDLPLAEIALACGFADQSHFTVTFKKATALTPGAYRREART